MDMLRGWLRNWSISRCANTKAEESLRFVEFELIEAGTNCATATMPTSRMTMAMRTSTKVKPTWRFLILLAVEYWRFVMVLS